MTCIQCTIHPETSTRKLDPCSFPKQRWSDWDIWSDLFCGHVCHLEKWNAGFRLRGDYWKMTFEKGLRWWSERRPKLVCHWSCFWWCKGVVFGRLQNGYQGASREMSGWQIQTLVETPNGDTPLGTNISLPQQRLKMIFLFPRRRDMLVSWRVHQVL